MKRETKKKRSKAVWRPAPTPLLLRRQSGKISSDLSTWLEKGRRYHDLCRRSFLEKRVIGFYFYERRAEWRTCALAAAYAGCYGRHSVEKDGFSYDAVVTGLSARLGYNIHHYKIPTGQRGMMPVARFMIESIDLYDWNREQVAMYLRKIGL